EIARPGRVFGNQNEEQQSRVDAAVVDGTLRNLRQTRELPAPQLVQNFARLSVAVLIDLRRLETREQPRGLPGDLRPERARFHRADRGIPTEERHEPGHASCDVA